ncbi:MAG: amidohydrolase family protein [Planctomycetes bacterium]|nr:amidohydrolase family protein [Planctomycetota bacterium]
MRTLVLSFAAAASLAAQPAPASGAGGAVALKAGTVHLVDTGVVLEGGVTILVRDGRIEAVGKQLTVPPDARVVDYGPDAVIVPGLIAANSVYGMGMPSERTADFGVRAIDNFDPYGQSIAPGGMQYGRAELDDVSAGITAVYLRPTSVRLIGGQGAVLKLSGDGLAQRLVLAPALVDGSITDDARNTPGYWKPPIPATADVGLGLQKRQLPQTAGGAIVALREIAAVLRGGPDTGEYGPSLAVEGRELWQARTPWRIDASSAYEIRALLDLAQELRLPLVLGGGREADLLASELAGANVPVVFEVDMAPGSAGRDLGRGDEVSWPRYDVCAKLAEKGVKFAIAPSLGLRPRNLRYAAALASRGGLSQAAALRAITLSPAEILGVSQRLGSITVGKDADFCVLNGAPIQATSSVLATWVSGVERWNSARDTVIDAEARAKAAGAFGADSARAANPLPGPTVLEVERLYLGDGQVLAPGQVLLDKGRIVEVGERVSHPGGARVVRGYAAMPGMIDAFGHLGLEGSQRTPDLDFKFARIVERGDATDRRVAKAGITTVMLSPRGQNPTGVNLMAYKPAGQDLSLMIVEDPAAMRMMWSDRNRMESGRAVRDTLAKAVEYKKKWEAYEEAKAKWVPPAPAPAAVELGPKDGEKKDAEKKSESGDAKEGEKKEEKKDDKKKEEEGDPVNGIWEAKLIVPPYSEPSNFRLRLEHDGEKLTGSLRCDPLSSILIDLTGTYTEKEKETPKDPKKAAKEGEGEKKAESGDAKEGEKKDEAKKEEPKKEESKKDDSKKKGKEPPKEKKFEAAGMGSRGNVTLSGEFKDGKLDGKLVLGETSVAFVLERTSKELQYARRPERRRPKEEPKVDAPKGEPKAPGVDPRLEGLRQAMLGNRAVIVDVDRDDELLACVAAFEAAGIRPILFGAGDAVKLADELRGRVSGVLLSPLVTTSDAKLGVGSTTNRYAALAASGIQVAFKSEAEEGAAELPLLASYAVSQGLSPEVALRALTSGAAAMMRIDNRVGMLRAGLDGDVLLLDGPPLDPATSVLRAWVAGREVQ